jgi:transcriptional regulator with XRE-family HTH domain
MIRDLEFCNSDTTAANWDKLEAILGVDLAVLRVKAFFDCRALTPNRRLDRERYLALRKIRVGKGLSMARLAQMAGVTPGTISALETCGYRGSARVWARLEIALGVDQKILRSFCRIDPLDAKRPEAAGPDGQQDAAPQAPLAVADPVSLDADPGDPAPPATGRGPIFLRRARIGKGITQKRLARMVGAKSRAVSSIETGRYGGSAEFWAKTEAAMGIGRETLRAIDLEPIDAYLLRDTHGRRSLPPMRGNIHRGAIPRNRGAMLGRAAAALAVIAAIIVGVWNW